MNKNKKNYNKIFGLSLLVFICFSFLIDVSTVNAYWEYQNPGEIQTQICGHANTDENGCNARVKTACGADTTAHCVHSTVQCNNTGTGTLIIDCPIPITGQKTTGPTDVYTLLAPIGELTTAPTNVGDYFNTIFLIAIGLCGALAVIMIVIGGIQYMGDESIFGKTEAKSRITSAILGLLIALGAYALLNTINPDLLKTNINIKQVSAAIDDTPILVESTVPATGGAVGTCSVGLAPVIVGGVTVMNTCASVSSQIAALITKANQAGVNLSGKSYRSNTDQMKLRVRNCANALTTPSNQCNPPTAKAGSSLHESGLAIDFKCSGVSIQTTDNVCFLWLKTNAGGLLINYPSEPWHWSTTGH